LFYYLYGTVNFANSAFSKLLYSAEAENDKLKRLNVLRDTWLDTLKSIRSAILQEQQTFDHVSSFVPEREGVFIREQVNDFVAASLLNDSENNFIKKYLYKVSRQAKEWLENNQSNSDITLLCDASEQLHSLTDEQRSRVVVQVGENTSHEDLEISQNDQRTIIYHHPEFDFKRDTNRYLNGEVAIYHALNKASWTVKAWIQREIALLIIPKLYFVGENKEISDGLRTYAESILSKFSESMLYIDFPNYIMVPKENVQYSDYIVDKLGNRGVVHRGKPNAESLFFEGVSVEEGRQQLKNNKLWWGFESE